MGVTDFVCNDDGLMWPTALTAGAEELVLSRVYRLYIIIILYYLDHSHIWNEISVGRQNLPLILKYFKRIFEWD